MRNNITDRLDDLVASAPEARFEDLDVTIARGRRLVARRAVARTTLVVAGVAGLSLAVAAPLLVRGSPTRVEHPPAAPTSVAVSASVAATLTAAADGPEARFGATVSALLPAQGRVDSVKVRPFPASGGQAPRDYRAFALYADGPRRGSVEVRVFDARGPEGTVETELAHSCEPATYPAPECQPPVQRPDGSVLYRMREMTTPGARAFVGAALVRPNGTVVNALAMTDVERVGFPAQTGAPQLTRPALTLDQLVAIVTHPSLVLPG